METKEIVAQMLKEGATKIDNLVIRNVNVTTKGDYTRLGFTLDKEVPSYVSNKDDEFELSKHNVIFSSLFATAAVLRNMDECCFIVSRLIKSPDAIGFILSRATISIVQQSVKAGEEYKNPFSEDADSVVFDHDTIINHIVKIELSDFGKNCVNKMVDMAMSKALE